MLDTVSHAEPRTGNTSARKPHGNTSTGLKFLTCQVGESFEVSPEEYTKANSARAHFKKRMWRLHRKEVSFTSHQVKDESGRVIAHIFTREK